MRSDKGEERREERREGERREKRGVTREKRGRERGCGRCESHYHATAIDLVMYN